MAVAYANPRGRSSSLADVLDLVLDKGIVIDAYVRVSLVGIEIVTVDARIVVASVDTYLRFAEAVNRLELGGGESTQARGLPETIGRMQEDGAQSKAQGVLSGGGETVRSQLPGGDEQERQGRQRGDGGQRQEAQSQESDGGVQ